MATFAGMQRPNLLTLAAERQCNPNYNYRLHSLLAIYFRLAASLALGVASTFRSPKAY
jgi:hypothetical protein